MNDTTDLLFPWRIRICSSPDGNPPARIGQLAFELSICDGHPVSDGGGLLYGFHSRWRRDRVLDSIRGSYGLASAEAVSDFVEVR